MFSKIGLFFKKIDRKFKDFLFKNRFGTVMLLVGIIVAFWDLTLKYLLDEKIMSGIDGIFNITSAHNSGGAWSIFSNATIFLIIITIVFIIVLIAFNFLLQTKNYFYAISMGLLLSGAICNLYDRIAFGYVRDFINLEFINFPIFNIADMAICVGIFLLCIYFIFVMPKLESKNIEKENKEAKLFVNGYVVSTTETKSKKVSKNTKIKKEKNG